MLKNHILLFDPFKGMKKHSMRKIKANQIMFVHQNSSYLLTSYNDHISFVKVGNDDNYLPNEVNSVSHNPIEVKFVECGVLEIK